MKQQCPSTQLHEDIVKVEVERKADAFPSWPTVITLSLSEIGGMYSLETGLATRESPDLVVVCYDIEAPPQYRYQLTEVC